MPPKNTNIYWKRYHKDIQQFKLAAILSLEFESVGHEFLSNSQNIQQRKENFHWLNHTKSFHRFLF